MKTKPTLLWLTLLVIATNSCTEKDFDLNKPNVGQFVSLLKSGN